MVHADYSQRGAPVRVAFFDDRIEIENPGILLPGMTIEDMKQGVSKIRNPVIAGVPRIGIDRAMGQRGACIFREAEELGLSAPEFMEIGMRMRFIVRLEKPLRVENSEAQVGAQVEAQVDRDILAACVPQPLSSAAIAGALGHKQLSGNLRKALSRLRKNGLLEYTLPAKPNSRLQKYRVTEKGRAAVESCHSELG